MLPVIRTACKDGRRSARKHREQKIEDAIKRTDRVRVFRGSHQRVPQRREGWR